MYMKIWHISKDRSKNIFSLYIYIYIYIYINIGIYQRIEVKIFSVYIYKNIGIYQRIEVKIYSVNTHKKILASCLLTSLYDDLK